MIPDTKNGLPAMASVSAMQKAIRRGMEKRSDGVRRRTHAHQQGVSLDGLQKTDNLGGRLRLYVEAIFHNA